MSIKNIFSLLSAFDSTVLPSSFLFYLVQWVIKEISFGGLLFVVIYKGWPLLFLKNGNFTREGKLRYEN
jgi:hypothetical protein